MSLVLLGNADDKSQVGFHQALECLCVAMLDAYGKFGLLFRRDHWVFVDVRQVLVYGLATDRYGLSNLKLLHVDD